MIIVERKKKKNNDQGLFFKIFNVQIQFIYLFILYSISVNMGPYGSEKNVKKRLLPHVAPDVFHTRFS